MRRYITLLLVGVLLLQWNAALAHCLQMQQEMLSARLELCVPGDAPADRDDSKKPHIMSATLYCPVCQVLSAADIPPSLAVAAPVFYGESSFAPYIPHAPAEARVRGGFQPRAPPAV